jgi:thiamine biosynthesis protein ThiS
MFVIVNGQTHPLADRCTLAELLRGLAPSAPFAVARNEEFISRLHYEQCAITEGDRIEIVHPMVGG